MFVKIGFRPAEDGQLRVDAPALHQAATMFGTMQIRNMATLAGNIARDPDRAGELLERRHEELAEQAVEVLANLRGGAMKIGQLASFLDVDFIPPEYRDVYQEKLATLRDSAPPMDWKKVRKVLESEWGEKPEALFESFDESAAAAASIGQVHRAVLPDGRTVAVKVQYPEIADALEADLGTAAILVAMAVPAAETLIRMEDTRDSELTIKVTGYQWRWHYDYIDDGVRFFSTLDRESNAARRVDSGIDPNGVENYLLAVDNELVVPVDTKVTVLIRSQDVIHSFFLPNIRLKQDAVPGMEITVWFEATQTGEFPIGCAELCGIGHTRMRGRLLVHGSLDGPVADSLPAGTGSKRRQRKGNGNNRGFGRGRLRQAGSRLRQQAAPGICRLLQSWSHARSFRHFSGSEARGGKGTRSPLDEAQRKISTSGRGGAIALRGLKSSDTINFFSPRLRPGAFFDHWSRWEM